MDQQARPCPHPAGHRPTPRESYRLQVGCRAPLASQLGMYVTSGQISDAGVPGGRHVTKDPESLRDTGLLWGPHRPALVTWFLPPTLTFRQASVKTRESEDECFLPVFQARGTNPAEAPATAQAF